MVKKWFKTIDGKKALAIGYVIALVVLGIEAIRYVISLILDYFVFGASFDKVVESYGYAIGLLVAILILYFLIRRCEWK